jgi:hypothetical protein
VSSRLGRATRRQARPASAAFRSLLRCLPEQDLHLQRRGVTWVVFCCNDGTARGRGRSIDAALGRLASSLGTELPRGRPVLDETTTRLIELCAELCGPRVFVLEHVHGVWSSRWRRAPDRYHAAERPLDALLGAMRDWYAHHAMPPRVPRAKRG